MRLPGAPQGLRTTSVRQWNAERMNDFRGLGMCGRYCSQGGAVAASGPIVSACFAELSEAVCDGCGTRKIMYGLRCTQSIARDGCTSMHVRKPGTTPDYTPKVSHLPLEWSLIAPDTRPGWGKKMSYCIAFSIDGATDVTRRYVRNAADHGTERNKCPEEVLMFIINEIRRMRRETMLKEERKHLIIEDEREEKELRGYVVQALATSIGNMLPGGGASGLNGEEIKLPNRTSGTEAWRQERGENGTNGHPPDRSRREGH